MSYNLYIELGSLRLETPSTSGPYPPLTHYTSMAGLEGIIGSCSLRATAYEYLNDTTEGVYGVGLLGNAIAELESCSDFDSFSGKYFLRKLRGAVEVQQSYLAREQTPSQKTLSHTCVACFTMERDQLSQWRGYANGVGGVSIQFPSQSVAKLTEMQDWRLVECNYSDRMDPQLVVSLLLKLYSFWENQGDGPLEDVVFEACAVLLVDATSDYLAQFKHPKFIEEAEWRLVSAQPRSYTDLEYRVGTSSLIPYAEIALSLPLVEESEGAVGTLSVTCGPNPQPLTTRKAIQGYLWKTKIAAEVMNSEIPFR